MYLVKVNVYIICTTSPNGPCSPCSPGRPCVCVCVCVGGGGGGGGGVGNNITTYEHMTI